MNPYIYRMKPKKKKRALPQVDRGTKILSKYSSIQDYRIHPRSRILDPAGLLHVKLMSEIIRKSILKRELSRKLFTHQCVAQTPNAEPDTPLKATMLSRRQRCMCSCLLQLVVSGRRFWPCVAKKTGTIPILVGRAIGADRAVD